MVVGAVLLLLILSVGITLAVLNHKRDLNTATIAGSGPDFNAAQKTLKTFNENQEKHIDKLAGNIKTLDDLKKLKEPDQGRVGMVLVAKLIETDKAKAWTYIEYLMLRNDAVGLDASRYCYRLNKGDKSAQDICFNRAQEQAIKQGIIKPSQSLPSNYLGDTAVGEELG